MTAAETAADKVQRLLAALDDAIDLAETVIENEFSGTRQYAEWMEKVERLRAIQTQEQQS